MNEKELTVYIVMFVALYFILAFSGRADESVQYRVIETTNSEYRIEFKAERSPFWRTHTNTYATSNEAASIVSTLPTNKRP